MSRIYSVAGLIDRAAPVVRARPVRRRTIPSRPSARRRRAAGPVRARHRSRIAGSCPRRAAPLPRRRARRAAGAARVWDGDHRPGRRGADHAGALQAARRSNPCPCGWRGSRGHECACDEGGARRYGARVSGPLRDRVDLWVAMEEPSGLQFGSSGGDRSDAAARRIAAAWQAQRERQGSLNSDLAAHRLADDAILTGARGAASRWRRAGSGSTRGAPSAPVAWHARSPISTDARPCHRPMSPRRSTTSPGRHDDRRRVAWTTARHRRRRRRRHRGASTGPVPATPARLARPRPAVRGPLGSSRLGGAVARPRDGTSQLWRDPGPPRDGTRSVARGRGAHAADPSRGAGYRPGVAAAATHAARRGV